MTRCAYLRVYVPVESVSVEEMRFWEGRAALPGGAYTDVRMSSYGLLNEPLGEDAYLTEWSGRRFVCPRRPRLRILEGVLAFHNTYPASRVVPETTVLRAAEELEALRHRYPSLRPAILTSPWHVPLRWFAGFAAEEREVRRGPEGMSIRYRTLRSTATSRLGRAVRVLESAGFGEAVSGEVGDLVEWLGDFPADAMVELDYGTVARMFSEGDLALDDSAAEITASLDALEQGDIDRATEKYAAAATRWAPAQAVTYSN